MDRDRAIKIIIDAEQFGDANACKKWEITRQTLRNYRNRLDEDPELCQALAILRGKAERSWKRERQRFLGRALRRAAALLKNEEDLDKVSRAIERIGNLDVASEALSGGSSRTNSESSEVAKPFEQHGEGEPGEGPVVLQ
jgi:hypothetical protein